MGSRLVICGIDNFSQQSSKLIERNLWPIYCIKLQSGPLQLNCIHIMLFFLIFFFYKLIGREFFSHSKCGTYENQGNFTWNANVTSQRKIKTLRNFLHVNSFWEIVVSSHNRKFVTSRKTLFCSNAKQDVWVGKQVQGWTLQGSHLYEYQWTNFGLDFFISSFHIFYTVLYLLMNFNVCLI